MGAQGALRIAELRHRNSDRALVLAQQKAVAQKGIATSPPLFLSWQERGQGARSVEFEIFERKKASDVPNGTVWRARATCLCCGAVLPPDRVRAHLREQRGGADVIFDANGKRIGGARLLAVVTLHPSPSN